MIKDDINQVKIEDITLYSFDMLAKATEGFHAASKLGQGGFGPVYKVMFIDKFLQGSDKLKNMK